MMNSKKERIEKEEAIVSNDWVDTTIVDAYLNLDAHFGNYYDKYAAMCGMIYLGRQWQSGGIGRLKDIFYQGYHDFAIKTVGR